MSECPRIPQARKADVEYLGPDHPPFDVPALAPALRALRHAGGVYGSLARAFTHADANFGDLVKARRDCLSPLGLDTHHTLFRLWMNRLRRPRESCCVCQ